MNTNKELHREWKKKWRSSERVKAYDKAHHKQWAEQHRDALNEYMRKWRAENKEQVNAKQRAAYAKKKLNGDLYLPPAEISRAHVAVHAALKKGKLVRPASCQRCGGPGPIEAHHANGYDKDNKLNVEWLCRCCHMSEHKIYK